MPDNIYPDFTKSKFDVSYAKRKLLSSDLIFTQSPLHDGITNDEEGTIPSDPTDITGTPGIDEVLAVEESLTANRYIDLDIFNLALLNMQDAPVGGTYDAILRDTTTGNLYKGTLSGGSGKELVPFTGVDTLTIAWDSTRIARFGVAGVFQVEIVDGDGVIRQRFVQAVPDSLVDTSSYTFDFGDTVDGRIVIS